MPTYNENTLNWLKKRSTINLLTYYQKNLDDIPMKRKHRLLQEGLIQRRNDHKLELTEKGLQLLEKQDDVVNL